MVHTPIEIAVQDAAGARIALENGAARVELCQALALGGLTPSGGLIEAAVEAELEAGHIGFVHVLIRPRGGGFVYDAAEIAEIERDIRLSVRLGAEGVVVGALTDRGMLDREAIARFVDAADGHDVTVHRAVDSAVDTRQAVGDLAGLGVRRVLTSGGASDCRGGFETLRRLVADSGDLEIMAGGGVHLDDIAPLFEAGLDAVHLSARIVCEAGGASGPGGGVVGFDATDAATVRAAVAAASGRV